MRLSALLPFALAASLCGADKGPSTATAGNERLAITATVFIGKDAVREQLGSDLNGDFIVVRAELVPHGDKPLAVSIDDFLLRSFKDGQKSGAFAPTQIAGRDALVIGERPDGMIGADDRGPSWGGIGGPPQRLPGNSPGIGNAAGAPAATAKVVTGSKQKDDPVLVALKQKILPSAQTTKPVSGLLYFRLEGKHKAKDVQLVYDGPAGKLRLKFR